MTLRRVSYKACKHAQPKQTSEHCFRHQLAWHFKTSIHLNSNNYAWYVSLTLGRSIGRFSTLFPKCCVDNFKGKPLKTLAPAREAPLRWSSGRLFALWDVPRRIWYFELYSNVFLWYESLLNNNIIWFLLTGGRRVRNLIYKLLLRLTRLLEWVTRQSTDTFSKHAEWKWLPEKARLS